MKYAKPGGPPKKSKQASGSDTIELPGLRKRKHVHLEIKSEPGGTERRIVNDAAKPRAPLGAAVEQPRPRFSPREQKQISAGTTSEAGNSVSDSPDVRVWTGGEHFQVVDSSFDTEWQEVSKPLPVRFFISPERQTIVVIVGLRRARLLKRSTQLI